MNKRISWIVVAVLVFSLLGSVQTVQAAEETISDNTVVTDASAEISANDAGTEDVDAEELSDEQEELDAEELVNATATDDGMKLYAVYIGEKRGDCVLLESNGEYLLMDLGTKELPVMVEFLDSLIEDKEVSE